MKFTLILTVLYLNGNNWYQKEVDIQTVAPSYTQCMSDQMSMAKYINEHPNYKIVKWHCEEITNRKIKI